MKLRTRVCATPDCPILFRDAGKSGKCPAHRTEQERQRGSRTQRGYGTEHQRTRALLLPAAIGIPCPLCGKVMTADQALDLDHTVPLIVDPASRGDRICHASCNRRRRDGQ